MSDHPLEALARKDTPPSLLLARGFVSSFYVKKSQKLIVFAIDLKCIVTHADVGYSITFDNAGNVYYPSCTFEEVREFLDSLYATSNGCGTEVSKAVDDLSAKVRELQDLTPMLDLSSVVKSAESVASAANVQMSECKRQADLDEARVAGPHREQAKLAASIESLRGRVQEETRRFEKAQMHMAELRNEYKRLYGMMDDGHEWTELAELLQ